MMVLRQRPRCVRVGMALASAVVLSACFQSFEGVGARPEGYRLVSGELVIPFDGLIGRQVTGLQIAAVAIGTDGARQTVDVFTSVIFDPGVRRQESQFVVAVDGELPFHLLLQLPRGVDQPGKYLGLLKFDDGWDGASTLINDPLGQQSLIPQGETDIFLGRVEALPNSPDTAADNVLVAGLGNNPLRQLDTDGDGINDFLDNDDDDDGTVDAVDEDVSGDSVPDVQQQLSALADTNDDGIPDIFE